MALNSSGPLSLGGSTVGQSINLELGQSATALASINAANFRALAGVPSGQISISNFYGKSSESYFLAFTNGVSFRGISKSTGGTIVVTGIDNSSSKGVMLSIASTGAKNLGYYVNTTTGGDRTYGWGSVYNSATGMSGTLGNQGTTFTTAGSLTSKYNQRNINGTGSPLYTNGFPSTNFITADSSGNVYKTGTIAFSPSCCPYYMMYVGKYNSTQSTHTWGSWTSANYTFNSYGNGIVLNPAQTEVIVSSFYKTAAYNPGSTGSGMGLFSFSASSGAKNWGYMWRADPSNSSSTYNIYGNGCAVDSSGNIYACGYRTGGQQDGIVIKTNSSGTLQWSRQLRSTGGGGIVKLSSIGVDSSANVYVVGADLGVSPTNLVIVKYNSSGTLLWQRKITNVDGFNVDDGNNGLISDGNAFIFGARHGASNCFFGKVPPDGSGTGTYSIFPGTFVYAAGTLTDAAITLYRNEAYWPTNNGNTQNTFDNYTNTVADLGTSILYNYQVL